MKPEDKEQLAQARAMIKAVYDDGEAEINGRKYVFGKMVHKQRRKVFAFYSKVADAANSGDLSFLDSAEFDTVMDVIGKVTLFDGQALVKLGDEHWEEHPEDYIPFITTAMAVISFPFMSANLTD